MKLQEAGRIKMIKVVAYLDPNEILACKASSATCRLSFTEILLWTLELICQKLGIFFSTLYPEHSALESFQP